ncbi:hypothetical protein B0H17DRAFT_1245354 [Mycena rosella]|uniref:Uncharacterized protein n=1 Tax=Mycena rosella TaxID=1033263 RepID=A0AAD7CYY1_MYCRO|nr:hypothetical protein B0H17DRAFT_1245354 [Mycena rosella]
MFGITVFGGTLSMEIAGGRETRVLLPVEAATAITGGTGKDVELTGGCNGFNVSLSAKVELYGTGTVGPWNQHYLPKDWTWPLCTGCIKLAEAKNKGRLSEELTIPAHGYYNKDITLLTIETAFSTAGTDHPLDLVWLPRPDPNIYAVPPLYEEVGLGVMNRIFQSATSLADTNATVGVYDERVLYFMQWHMETYVIAALKIAPSGTGHGRVG